MAVDDYVPPLSRLIHALKFSGQIALARPLARLLLLAVLQARRTRALPKVDMVLNVPLYRRRHWRRGYNQSDLLCRPLARWLGCQYPAAALTRRHATAIQHQLSARLRKRNLKNAFRLEFAVKGLKVKEIIVLGHSMCGGVHALANQDDNTKSKFEFLTHWISIGDMARQKVDALYPSATPEHRQCAIEKEVIVTSLNNLLTFPWVKSAVDDGKITLHGWYFDMKNGALLDYDMGTGVFNELNHPNPEEFMHSFRRRKGDR